MAPDYGETMDEPVTSAPTGPAMAGAGPAGPAGVDHLAEGLRALRMRGSLFSRAELAAPFGVRSGPLGFGVFHAVVSGRCVLRVPEVDRVGPIEMVEGDVVYLPNGDDHIVADKEWRPASPHASFRGRPGPDGMDLLKVSGGGRETVLLCGRGGAR